VPLPVHHRDHLAQWSSTGGDSSCQVHSTMTEDILGCHDRVGVVAGDSQIGTRVATKHLTGHRMTSMTQMSVVLSENHWFKAFRNIPTHFWGPAEPVLEECLYGVTGVHVTPLNLQY
jgi:hypothetical protein